MSSARQNKVRYLPTTYSVCAIYGISALFFFSLNSQVARTKLNACALKLNLNSAVSSLVRLEFGAEYWSRRRRSTWKLKKQMYWAYPVLFCRDMMGQCTWSIISQIDQVSERGRKNKAKWFAWSNNMNTSSVHCPPRWPPRSMWSFACIAFASVFCSSIFDVRSTDWAVAWRKPLESAEGRAERTAARMSQQSKTVANTPGV